MAHNDVSSADDIQALFCHYNDLYFHGALGPCTVDWSPSRTTTGTGTCKYETSGGCAIRLSEPLLRDRSRADLKDTLLHEMIHAHLFLSDGTKDHEDHGPRFESFMKEINSSDVKDSERPEEGYHISVYHNFRGEMGMHHTHNWRCLECGHIMKTAMKRPPTAADCPSKSSSDKPCASLACSWHMHEKGCKGRHLNITESSDNTYPKRSKASEDRLERAKTTSKRKNDNSVNFELVEDFVLHNPLDRFFIGNFVKKPRTKRNQGRQGSVEPVELVGVGWKDWWGLEGQERGESLVDRRHERRLQNRVVEEPNQKLGESHNENEVPCTPSRRHVSVWGKQMVDATESRMYIPKHTDMVVVDDETEASSTVIRYDMYTLGDTTEPYVVIGRQVQSKGLLQVPSMAEGSQRKELPLTHGDKVCKVQLQWKESGKISDSCSPDTGNMVAARQGSSGSQLPVVTGHCPICSEAFFGDLGGDIVNQHIDKCLLQVTSA